MNFKGRRSRISREEGAEYQGEKGVKCQGEMEWRISRRVEWQGKKEFNAKGRRRGEYIINACLETDNRRGDQSVLLNNLF